MQKWLYFTFPLDWCECSDPSCTTSAHAEDKVVIFVDAFVWLAADMHERPWMLKAQ